MLCCQVNPVVYCLRCNIKGCEEHKAELSDLTCPKPYDLPTPNEKGETVFFITHAIVDSTAKRYG